MTVAESSFAAIDFESAGIRRGGTDVPVQIGIAVLECQKFSDTFTSFLCTDQPITWAAQKVHGIRARDLAGEPLRLELWPEIRKLLENRWIVAHGSATERRFLRAFPFHGFGPWVDTLKLSRALWPSRKSFALGDLIVDLDLGGEVRNALPGFRWHNALSDAVASLVLLRRVVNEAGVAAEDAEILLRADDSTYYRLKAK
jgi:DNA polymerase III subunit epsilon